MDRDLQQLNQSWGHNGLCFDHPWIDTSALPTSIHELESFLQRLPEKTVYVRIPGETPNAGELPRINLFRPGELESRLNETVLHVLGVNLQNVSEAFKHFQDRFIDRIRFVLQSHGVEESVEAATAVFISSANSIVPFHGDPEHNFLFQIMGEKKFHIFPNTDLELFPSRYRERLTRTRQCVLDYDASFEDKATVFELKPGCATYQPPLAPHWVEAGDTINVSVAVSVYTADEENTRLLNALNHQLRRLHYSPSPVGRYPWHDMAKGIAAKSLQGIKHRLKGTMPAGHF